MHQSVLDAWHRFSTPFEGRVPFIYSDVKRLLTTGVGNLIDPVSEAIKLPWKLPDGSLATADEVRRQWQAVKDRAEDLWDKHWRQAGPLTTIRLTDEDIDTLVHEKLIANEAYIRARVFPDWDEFPADAQLAILSMAWAAGAGLNRVFPTFCGYVRQGDWIAASIAGKLKETNNAGVIPRNKANLLCFKNAAAVKDSKSDCSTLWWPRAAETAKTDPAPAPTAEPKGRLIPGDEFAAAAAKLPPLPLERDEEQIAAERAERDKQIAGKDYT